MKKASRQKNSDFVQHRLRNPFVKGGSNHQQQPTYMKIKHIVAASIACAAQCQKMILT
jgi:hypothetical protein